MSSPPCIARPLVAFALVFTAIGASTTVCAQGPVDPVAADLKRRGDEAIDAGLYEEALDAYTRAQAVQPSPALHYNRGRALQALGRFTEALNELEEFERTAPPELRAAVPRLAEMIAAVRSHVGRLTVNTRPEAARIYLDDVEVADRRVGGLVVDAGEHTLRVESAEYISHEQRFSLERGQERTLTIELTPVPTRGVVRVTSPVAGAEVDVDGRPSGTVPLDVSLAPGAHDLRVHHPDFAEANNVIVIEAGRRQTLHVDLDRHPRFYERWWFWAGVGLVVAGGVVTVYALTTEKEPGRGDIAPGRITAPLLSF